MSLPSRERGLKYAVKPNGRYPKAVAPLAGAWIEICLFDKAVDRLIRRSPRGSVD